jgi:hypothetical protein
MDKKFFLLIAAILVVFSSLPAHANSIILQVNSTEYMADIWVDKSDAASLAYGFRNDLVVNTVGAAGATRVYATYNITNLTNLGLTPSDIQFAYVYFRNKQNFSNGVVTAYHCYNTFNESDTSWNNQLGGTTDPLVDSANCNGTSYSSTGSWDGAQDLQINLTNMLKVAMAQGRKNLTFVLTADARIHTLWSKDPAPASLSPYMNITYSTAQNSAPNVTIVSPTNSTYLSNYVLLNFTPVDAQNTSVNCWYKIDNAALVSLGTINNNTANVTNITNLYHGTHNATVICEDLATTRLNGTSTVWFTTLHYNVTGEEWDATQYETSRTLVAINVTVGAGISNIDAVLNHNNTQVTATKSGTYRFNTSLILPVIQTNATNLPFNWSLTLNYTNGTSNTFLSTSRTNTVIWAYTVLLTANNTQVAEGTPMNITANLSAILPLVNDDRTVTAIVNITYNNTVNVTSFLYNVSNMYFYNFSFVAREITGTLNASTYYNATLYISYGGMTRSVQTFQYIHWIDNIDFANCTAGTVALNFTFYDERAPDTRITSGNTLNIDLRTWLENGTFFGNFSFALNDNTQFAICIQPSYSTLRTNATVIFKSTDFYQRTYYLVNAPLSSTVTQINLYLLNTTLDGTARVFIETVVGVPAPNLYVRAERYYAQNASAGAYKTVAILKTADPLGDAFTALEYTNAFYRFTVLRDNVVLKTFSNRQIEKDSLTDIYATVVLRLTEGTGEYYQYIKGTLVGVSCASSNVTGIVSCSVQDTSGLLASALLNVTKKVSNSWVQACTNTLSSTGGTVVCNVSSSGNGIYRYYLNVYTAANKYTQFTDTFQLGQNVELGAGGLVIALFIFLMMSFIFIYNFKIAIATGILGLAASLLLTNSWELAGGFFISIAVIGGIFVVRGNK